jgi:hypothetical protein
MSYRYQSKRLIMRKRHWILSLLSLFLVIIACKKTTPSSNPDAKTVQNLSGSYLITAINVNSSGVNFDEYASLTACQKDNIVKLNTDLSADYEDVGIICTPSETSTGTWSLSSNSDSLSISGISTFPQGLSALIQSWNGTTLVLVGTNQISGTTATTTVTLAKQ